MGEIVRFRMCFVGAKARDRTGDPTLFRRLLYQLSYLGKFISINLTLNKNYCNKLLKESAALWVAFILP